MSDPYIWLKWVHILSATVLFGTGLGTAFQMWITHMRGNVAAIAVTSRNVVLADWLFTTPAVIVQLVSGLWLVSVTGHDFTDRWVLWALGLYLFAGVCWLPVVAMQIRMRDMAKRAQKDGTPLPARYWQLERWWITLGALAFPAILVVFYLMVFRPT